jgi:hypothetical protein
MKSFWNNIFKQYIRMTNPYVSFAFIVALTGPVLRLFGRKGVGVIFYDSQLSSDILGPLAASLWGPVENFRLPGHRGGRAADREQWLRRRADGFFFVGNQDLQGPPQRAGELLDMLSTFAAEGFDDGNPDWVGPSVFIVETNRFPETLYGAARLDLDPTRLIFIPAGIASGYGRFHDLHNFPSAGHLSEHLQSLLSPTSGMVASEYLGRLTREYLKDPSGLASRFSDCALHYEQNLRKIEIDPSDLRVVGMFPVFYAVAKSLTSWNIIRMSDEVILELIKEFETVCLVHHLKGKGQRDLIRFAYNYITDNLNEFVEIPSDDLDNSKLKAVPGCCTLDEEGHYVELHIYPKTFRKAMAMAGVDAQRVLQACDEAGYMHRSLGSIEKKSQIRPGDGGRVQMYRFHAQILNHQPVDWFGDFDP